MRQLQMPAKNSLYPRLMNKMYDLKFALLRLILVDGGSALRQAFTIFIRLAISVVSGQNKISKPQPV